MRLETREEFQLLQEASKATILVVDDEEIIRDLCARALKDYCILEADNGRDAMQIINDRPVDVVLVDVMMPIMNGLDLLQQVKDKDADQLVIVMTGYADKDIILRALKAHADDFIQKPINLLQLKTSVAQALEKKALRRQLTQLKQLDRLKSDFLGLISHKLRTPTTSISLFIQNLASGTFNMEDPSFASAIDAIRKESEYLGSLIQDLLYYSDIILQDGESNTSEEDLKEIATKIIIERRQALRQKNQALHIQLDGEWPTVTVDRRRIELALGAILDNAIKFTSPGGEITVSGEQNDRELSLTISDNGPGIAPEEMGKIFEKFYQIDPNNTGQVRGFGLGLFYARQFLKDHGGEINLQSRVGQGTTVTVKLPRLSPQTG
jgi:signal transduction histidine kinase